MKKFYWIVAVAIIATALLVFLIAGISLVGGWNNWGLGMMGGLPTGSMHGWGLGSFGWAGIILMWLMLSGFVVLVVLGVVGLVRGISSIGERSTFINRRDESQASPREILQKRYAGGEITHEQYLQMLDDMN